MRAFFRNGGTRCWVVRVAERSSVNFFPIPGLARVSAGGIAPAFARGRADGGWCDSLRVGSAIAPTPIGVLRLTRDRDRLIVEATLASPDDLVAGDLLRLELATGHVVMLAVADAEVTDESPPSDRVRVRASGRAVWFHSKPPLSPGSSSLAAVAYTAMREQAGINETFARPPVPIINPFSQWPSATADGTLRLDLQIGVEDAPAPGALVSARVGADELWLSVRDVGVPGEQASGTDRVRVTGPGLWSIRTPPSGELRVTRCDRVSLELWVRSDDVQLLALRDLGLVPGHPRYWANLIDDDARYRLSEQDSSRLGALASERQFALAGAGPSDALYIPIDVALTPDRFLGAARQPRTALERDGLATFSPALFLDPDLIAPLSDSVMNEAEHIRYTAESPRRLAGIHAALEIEEATIISVPDASHRGWTRAIPEAPVPAQPPPGIPQPAWGTFLPCRTRVVEPPQWAPRFEPRVPFRFDSGTYTLEWRGRSDEHFVVEEAQGADWSDATVIYAGGESRLTIYGRAHGTYYYRVRATAGGQTSAYSREIVIIVAGVQSWHLVDEDSYSADTLLAVHRGLLRIAAARGDLFALLTLPEHYRAADAAAHVRLLKSGEGPIVPVTVDQSITPLSLPIGPAEARAFSFGALYHPWLILGEESATRLSRLPPDGSLAGLLARRALTRGAWIAPANEALGGVVAVSPPIAREEHEPLLDVRVNVIRQEARGFLPLSANTLSDDPDLGLINVRRLLSLLRRLALREGATYVFEPHDAAFERLVQRGFEGLLTHMFERGAFAGRTSDSAFQVNTSTSLNPARSIEQGRFIVELRVAPSLPMSFLTVRLIQSGDRTLVTEER